MSDAAWMASEVGKYQTLNTRVTAAGGGIRRVLIADPRRWYVEFAEVGAFAANPGIYPGPLPDGFTGASRTQQPDNWKFRDCPTAVTGEWFWNDVGANDLWITEVLYVGG